jgi:hypothetical protein
VKTIKFSHKYEKMPYEPTTAVLVGVEAWDIENLPPDFLDFDTLYQDKQGPNYYQLPKNGRVIVLFLWGRCENTLHFLFTTIRRCTESKWDYYHNSLGETFAIEIKEEPKP